MRVGLALSPWLDHVDPYKLMGNYIYVSDTYTNFARSNARAELSSNITKQESEE